MLGLRLSLLHFRTPPSASTFSRVRRPMEILFGGYLFFRNSTLSLNTHQETASFQKPSALSREANAPNKGVLQRIFGKIRTFLRFLQLALIFAPVALLLPLRLFAVTDRAWCWLFAKTIQMAGVVWIKTFQYLSHRRDIIGDRLAEQLVHLREHAPSHSFEETQRVFRKQFGKDVYQMFDSFPDQPIASASISQVYRAVYKGNKVAVKVRHPGVETNLARDIDILFAITGFLGKIHDSLSFPLTKESLKKTLTDQLDFRIQANNLNKFSEYFHLHHNVHFPKVYLEASGERILVESFAEGAAITTFEQNRDEVSKKIAKIGAMTFFEMLFKYNFVHADCHGGNFIVQVSPHYFSVKDFLLNILYRGFRIIENIAVKFSGESDIAKELYLETKRDQDESRKAMRKLGVRVDVTVIDAGMVIEMEERDRLNFVNFIRCLIEKEPEECAKMIYSLSLRGGKPILLGAARYRGYYEDLRKLFSKLTGLSIRDIKGLDILRGMLDAVRTHGMQLDGQLGALLTNMLVLQQIAKDLYPEMNILNCAVPYFYAPQP